MAAYPIWKLSLLEGLTSNQAILVAVIYLLYPLVFNASLYDFHPETIAIPSILWAILAARSKRLWQFCIALTIILACKEILSIAVAAMGLWLIFFEKRKLYGAIALFAGVVWFLITTQTIMPMFAGEQNLVARNLHRYADLGSSVSDIFLNFFFKPQLLLSRVFSLGTLEYMVLLFAPIIYIFAAKNKLFLLQLIPAIPTLIINILASDVGQRNIVYQYSLPIMPFLILAAIACLKSIPNWLTSRVIICWAIIGFLALSRLSFFFGEYWKYIDTYQANREAINRVQDRGSVLTTNEIAPHLSNRAIVKLAMVDRSFKDVNQFDYVLLNSRHPGWQSNAEFAKGLINELKNNPRFLLDYQSNDVYLFRKNS